MDKHLQILAVLHIVNGALNVLGGIIAFFILSGAGFLSGETTAMMTTGIVGIIVISICWSLGLPGIIGGLGMLFRKSWSRILLIIIGILNLFSFPIGTALGIYTLWVLLKPESEKLLAT